MAFFSFRRASALIGLGACLQAAPADAVGRVLSPSTGNASAEHLEVALARAPSRTTLFLRATVSGSASQFGVVVPVTAGSRLDPAAEGFFDALDDATAPRIVPPLATPRCGATTASSVDAAVLSDTSPTAFPKEVVHAADLGELESVALARGLALTSDDRDVFAGSHSGKRFILLTFDKTKPRMRTETVRIVSATTSSIVPLSLVSAGAAADVLLYVVDTERGRLSGDELEPVDVMPMWTVLSGTSDYLTRRHILLDGEDRHVVEATGTSPLFQWVLLPGGSGTIAPAVHGYFSRAHLAGQAPKKADECLIPMWDARDAGKQGATLARYCAPGALAVVPGTPPACDAKAGAGQIVAENIACGDADDFAAAFSEQNLSNVRITRMATRVDPKSGVHTLSQAGTKTVSPVAVAVGADASGCSGGSGGSGGGGGSGGYATGTGNASGGGYVPPAPEPYESEYVDEGSHTDVGFFCGGSAEGDSSCSGDSSSSSSDDGCSGDSSDSGSGDGACSGDTSDSGSGDACSGDTSSSSDGGGCSGDTSDGGGCSGDSGGGDCRLSGPRRRPRASIVGMGLCAIAFVLRRARRRRRPRRR